jgi:hypothetical protein
MKKLHVLGVALAALFAFGALTAASASAVTFLLAEWLKAGVGITTTELVDSESGEGGVLLEETILGIKIAAVCSGIFDGSIGPNGADEITELLTLPVSTLVSSTALVEPGLLCEPEQNCPEPLVWLDNLPWLTLAELMEDEGQSFFVDLIMSSGVGDPGYYVDCMNGTHDLCESKEAISKLTNEGNGTVHGEFSEAFTELAGLKLANCEIAGVEKGIVEGLGLL